MPCPGGVSHLEGGDTGGDSKLRTHLAYMANGGVSMQGRSGPSRLGVRKHLGTHSPSRAAASRSGVLEWQMERWVDIPAGAMPRSLGP